MNLPKSWQEISVYQFQELRGLSSPDSVFEWHLDVLELLTEEDVEDLSINEVDRLFSGLSWLKREPHKVYSKDIGHYHCKEFKDIRLGEFLDLEHYYEKGHIENLHIIAGIFYRKFRLNEWQNLIVEPYEYDPIKRGEEFLDRPITMIYGLGEEWLKYRNYLIKDAYSELFDGGDIEEEDLESLDPEEKAEVLKDQADQKRFARWSWESIIDHLAGGDKTKYKQVYELKLIFVLNQMSMMAETK